MYNIACCITIFFGQIRNAVAIKQNVDKYGGENNMKKRISIIMCMLLACMLALNTACIFKPNVSKLFGTIETAKNVKTIAGLSDKDQITSIDSYGLAIVKTAKEETVRENNVTHTEVVAHRYRLFNVKTSSFVSGADIEVKVNVETENLVSYTRNNPLTRLTDGMYVLHTVKYTRENVNAYNWEIQSQTYKVYGKDGHVVDVTFDANENPYYDGNLVTADGTRYYVKNDGSIAQRAGILDLVCNEYGAMKDFYIESCGETTYRIFNKEDKSYVRTVDFMSMFEVPAGTNTNVPRWSIENTIFVQYSVELPFDADEYDYTLNGQKFDLVTKSYNVKSDKVKDLELDYIVIDSYYSPMKKDNCAILDVQDIKDGYIVGSQYVQCFDKNGKVATDLQAVLPGANNVSVIGEYVCLGKEGETVILKGKDVVNTLYTTSGLTIKGTVGYHQPTSTSLDIYDLTTGAKVKSYTKILDHKQIGSNYDVSLVIKTEGSVVVYDLKTLSERKLLDYNKNEKTVSLSTYGVAVTDRGVDGQFGYNYEKNANDDKMSYIFYNGTTSKLSWSSNEDISVSGIGSIYFSEDNTSYTDNLVCITKTSTDTNGRTVYTYSYFIEEYTRTIVLEDK